MTGEANFQMIMYHHWNSLRGTCLYTISCKQVPVFTLSGLNESLPKCVENIDRIPQLDWIVDIRIVPN